MSDDEEVVPTDPVSEARMREQGLGIALVLAQGGNTIINSWVVDAKGHRIAIPNWPPEMP